MEAARKHLEEEKKKRAQQNSGQSNRSATSTTLAKQPSAQRIMNSSGSSFKAPQASSSDVRVGAQEDLDKLSMSSSRAKKKTAPRQLKPIAAKSQSTVDIKPPKSNKKATEPEVEVIQSGSLVHKQSNRVVGNGDSGAVIDMGLGGGLSINPMKKQRKQIMKDIDMDVNQFMKDFEETKSHAMAQVSDTASSISSMTTDSKI